jgi:hypothetical protein
MGRLKMLELFADAWEFVQTEWFAESFKFSVVFTLLVSFTFALVVGVKGIVKWFGRK